jgi:mono/diheme cytochrome c family protein
MNFGETVYATYCASCHATDGRGVPPDYPPLASNPSIPDAIGGERGPHGPERRVPAGTAGNPMPYGMPRFAQTLSDDEVAGVVTYIRAAWGNRGSPVSSRQANELRTVLCPASLARRSAGA